ncbi:cupin domain-containing protein [Pseudaestuariivita atlantica]|uniref:Cupin n=1 Tax=Pseudaestuariivita atlantica TaxID=1317121 RepID=A0A0L1JW64_9RHOB|nr:cupin domain-containing protein [Pseudaestuariivita atlantica]KNG95648.1 cupin [Pseudaestuariivita atlantica]
MQNIRAEVLLPTRDLQGDTAFFTDRLGFRMDEVFPADDPRVAVFSGYGLRLRLDRGLEAAPGVLRLLGDEPELIADGATTLDAPGGTRVEIAPLAPPVVMPPVEHAFVVRRLVDEAPWVVGRAGMQYRDLIPDRLGGSIIASHIRIPDGGPVPDMVHYHSVGFQLIFCIRGWVDLVYEDQGPPFRLHAGNCVIQPPEIRHRVLYASDNIEVIEIGVPAEHITTIDHQTPLPTGTFAPERLFDGQRFVHHEADKAEWLPARLPGFEARDTTIAANTGGVADVRVLRRAQGETGWTAHDADIHFSFVLKGGMRLAAKGHEARDLTAGDAFVIPPGLVTRVEAPSGDLELLEVALPGRVTTRIEG